MENGEWRIVGDTRPNSDGKWGTESAGHPQKHPQGIRRAARASADNEHEQQEREPKRADVKLTDTNRIGQNTECLADGMGVTATSRRLSEGLGKVGGQHQKVLLPGLVFWIHGGRDPVSANRSALH